MKNRGTNPVRIGAGFLLVLAILGEILAAQRSDPPSNATRPGRGVRIQGRVLPASGSSQVPEVMVVKLYQISGPLLETALVQSGRFLLPNVAAGNYRFRLEADGFEPTEQDFIVENVVAGRLEFVQLLLGASTTPPDAVRSGDSTVDAGALSLPPEALSELEHATKASRKKQYEKAIEHIRRAIELAPDYAPAYNNLGAQYLRVERYQEAQQAFRESLELQSSAAAFLNLGNLMMYQERLDEALPLLRAAHHLDPHDDLAIRSLGEASFRVGRYEDALRHFEDLSGRDKDPTLNLGKANCFLRLNRLEEARQEFKAFLKKESRGERADFVRAQLKKIAPE